MLAKKQFEPPVESVQDLYERFLPFHQDRSYPEYYKNAFGESGILAKRELFKRTMDNPDDFMYDFEEDGTRPKSLYDDMLNGMYVYIYLFGCVQYGIAITTGYYQWRSHMVYNCQFYNMGYGSILWGMGA